MHTLIVGATGQLGSQLMKLRKRFMPSTHVKGLIRSQANHVELACPPENLLFGDLTDKQSLLRACQGIDTVIATATVIFPKNGSHFEQDERQGYANLIAACEATGVKQLIFISIAVPFTAEFMQYAKTYELKKWCEDRLIQSPVKHTILRCSPFMDDYFALIGSQIPLKNEQHATLNRASGLTRFVRNRIARSIENHGLAWVPGNPDHKHAFIAVADVAKFCIQVCGNSDFYNKTIYVGGKESLSWKEICHIYANLLQRKVQPISLPAALLKMLHLVMKPFSESTANQLGVLWILATTETLRASHWSDCIPASELMSATQYLEGKFHEKLDV